MSSDNIQKANLLFEKAMSLYKQSNYEEALKYFEASNTLNKNSNTEVYIKTCKRLINNNNNTNYNNTSNTNYTNNTNNTQNQKKSTNSNEDIECENVIKEKDFYKILNIDKSAAPEVIKKAYKKMAIKLHPDKNHSSKAEEAFKKISQAYQILSDPKKKEFYDNHGGTEEEIRAQYQARYHQNYYDEELDPFDIFEMFVNGQIPRRNGPRRRYNYNTQQANIPVGFHAKILQLLPLIMIFISFVLPNLIELFKSVSFILIV